jgi:UDP:flavonoid glycosyltransferase YjiC (YdhE family)
MRISLLTAGSRGDVQPLVALGRGLRSAGHTVRLAAHEGFRELVTEHGLEFADVAHPSQAITSDPAWQRWQRSGDDVVRYMAGFARVARLARPALQAMLDDFWTACRGADAVVSSPSGVGSLVMADALGVPHAWALFQPMSRTRHAPHFMTPGRLRLGPRATAATHLLAEQVYWRLFRSVVDDWARRNLGRPRSSGPDPRAFAGSAPLQVLYGISPRVVPRPPDWTGAVSLCGYWFLDPVADWRPPPDLVDFLDRGPPPVYCHLAGINVTPRERLVDLVLEALRRSRQRGLLGTGGAGTDLGPLPATAAEVGSIPHSWLFGRVAAVVHHGGAGTTASALRAGVPSLGVPGFFDQPFWSRRVAALGAGPAPLPPRALTAERLAAAVHRMTADAAMRDRARRLGDGIRGERGVEVGVARLERFLAGAGAVSGGLRGA